MRRIATCALLVVSILPAACKRGEIKTLSQGEVSIKIDCRPDGSVAFDINPWAVTRSPAGDFTFINSSTDVDIDITTTGHFPFNGQSFHANHGNHATGKPIAGTPKGRYKYNINATCSDGRKIVIDPDMIIPT